MHRARAGTPGYWAPEVEAFKAYGKEIDVFSFGVMVRRLLCGTDPRVRGPVMGMSTAAARVVEDCMKESQSKFNLQVRKKAIFNRIDSNN